MNKALISLVLAGSLACTGCQKDIFRQPVTSCTSSGVIHNPAHPMKDSVEEIMARYINKGIPGIQVTIRNQDGWYSTAGGYAQIESRQPLQACSGSWLFSLTKAYTAALVMKQQEQGQIALDASIDQYLPADIAGRIKGSSQITVRMLLNHSSGLINFTELPAYMTGQFNNPADQPSFHEMLEMLYGKELLHAPGTEYFYSNSNYLLLQLILERTSGKSYQQLLTSEILQPLHLQQTWYHPGPGEISALNMPNYYFDRYANDQLENVSLWNNYLGNASYSWGGIAATASDAILFYEGLMEGRLVSSASLQQMTSWFQGQSSDAPDYGLGIEYWQFKPGSTPQRGHEGDGIGNSTMILYVPDNNTYLYINCTAGRKLFGPYLFKITDFKNELAGFVARWR